MINNQALIMVMNLWYIALGIGAIIIASWIVFGKEAAKNKRK